MLIIHNISTDDIFKMAAGQMNSPLHSMCTINLTENAEQQR